MTDSPEARRVASSDGTTSLNVLVWRPEGTPRGTLQLVHGMCEHISRYDGFARAAAERGWLVFGHDQVGHGDSCPPDQWGVIPAERGRDILVGDVGLVRQAVEAEAPEGDHFLFGHSMGSFVVRAYLETGAAGLSGAIICGTGFPAPAASRLGASLARTIARLRGNAHYSALLHSMADGPYTKAVPNHQTDFDWLSFDQDNVRRYIADPACGYRFSAGGYATLTSLTAEVCVPECTRRYPKDLPLLYMGGMEDPVGDNGAGVQKAADLAHSTGSTDVTVRLYEYMRHEVLNEAKRAKVYEGTLAWMDERASK